MGFFKKAGKAFSTILGFGASPGEEVGKLVGGISGGISSIRNAFAKEYSSAQKFEIENKLMEIQHLASQAQNHINMAEAQHPSTFVAGWRPFIGWTLGISLFLFFVPQYAMATYLWTKMCLAQQTLLPYPVSAYQVIELLMAMLGMGYMVSKRTQEKHLKIHDKH